MWVDALPIGSSSLFVLLVVLVVVFYDANWVSTFVVILCNKVTNTNHNHREREREREIAVRQLHRESNMAVWFGCNLIAHKYWHLTYTSQLH
jgi:hypothetical protein